MTDVTLRVSLKDGSLDVDQSGNANEIAHGQDVTIVWELVGNAASGTFDSMDSDHKGFQWMSPAPASSIFGPATLADNGKQIRMSDNNNQGNGSEGDWTYQLYATINGQSYHTNYMPSPSAAGSGIRPLVVTNPTIKNM